MGHFVGVHIGLEDAIDRRIGVTCHRHAIGAAPDAAIAKGHAAGVWQLVTTVFSSLPVLKSTSHAFSRDRHGAAPGSRSRRAPDRPQSHWASRAGQEQMRGPLLRVGIVARWRPFGSAAQFIDALFGLPQSRACHQASAHADTGQELSLVHLALPEYRRLQHVSRVLFFQTLAPGYGADQIRHCIQLYPAHNTKPTITR